MNSLKGHLLIASTSLLDPNFARAVLLMLEHSEEGAVGVILNRPTEATVSTIAEQAFQEPVDWEKPIHLGGPVPGPLMAVHTLEDLADREVVGGVFQTIDATMIRELVKQRAEPSLLIANYAGWGPGQLENEIEEDSWVSLPASREHVFCENAQDLWASVLREAQSAKLSKILGIREVPPDPSMN